MPDVVKAPIRAAAARERLLQAALQAFAERGFHGSTVRDIARLADLTPAALYHHFSGKQQLLETVMVAILTRALAATEGALVAGEAPDERLVRLTRAWVQFHAVHQREATVGATELMSLEPERRSVVVGLRDRQEHLFRQTIIDGVELGIFHTRNAAVATKGVIASGVSVAFWYRPQGARSPEQVADVYADLALATVGWTGRGPRDA